VTLTGFCFEGSTAGHKKIMEMQGTGPMLNRENFLQDWCATLGENRWLTLESVIEYVNLREGKLQTAAPEATKAQPLEAAAEDSSFDEILVGDTVYVRAGGFREHKVTGRNLRVYTEEGNPLTQVTELKVDTTPALLAELDWCIEEGQSGPRTRAALKAARAVLNDATAAALVWPNGCDTKVPAALRFLADHPRPSGGEQTFNAEQLYQLAGEIEQTVRRSHATTAAVVDAARDVEAYRKRAHAAERGCYRAGLVVDQASGEWAPPAAFGEKQPGAIYQVGKEVRGEVTWSDVEYARYARTLDESATASTREVFGLLPKMHVRIVFKNPAYAPPSASTGGIFAQSDCLKRWADAEEFWCAQMYGNRFYFGAGGLDYVPRDVLRAFVNRLGLDASGPSNAN
jgi:hypothetical protein